jgi:hypothetical protein
LKRTALIAGICLATAVLGGAWFLSTYERVETRVWVGPSPTARANPDLAAMRFLERLGMTPSLAPGLGTLNELPSGTALWLPAGRAGLSPGELRELQAWIQNGGHAIVEPEPARSQDLLLDKYGIARVDAPREQSEPTVRVHLPGANAPIVVSRVPGPVLMSQRLQPDAFASDVQAPWLVSFPIGAGRLTAVSGMRRFYNRSIGSHDNAELLRQVVALAPAVRHLLIVRMPSDLPLWGWLREHALPSLAAAAVWLLLWLVRTTPRFGPMHTAGAPQRRRLLEHIRATGRFRWAQGGRVALLDAARQVCHRHIAALLPRLAQLPEQQRYRELATRVGSDETSIATAFRGHPRTTRDFVHRVATLASIHARTGSRRSSATMQRRKA